MKKVISLFIVLMIISSCFLCENAYSLNENKDNLLISGLNGFTVNTGELYARIETLGGDKESEFYFGDNVSFERYMPFYPEILQLSYRSYGEAKIIITPYKKYSPKGNKENVLTEGDNDTFSYIEVSGIDQYSGFDIEAAIEKVSATIIYLTDDSFKSYDDAVNFLEDLKTIAMITPGALAEAGQFSYCYNREYIGTHGGHDFYGIDFSVGEIE